MSDHNFEKQIQQKLDELKIPPADTVWPSVEAQIRKDKRRRRGVIFFPVLLLLIGAGFYFVFQNYLPFSTNTGSKSTSANISQNNSDKNKNAPEKTNAAQGVTKQESAQDVANATKQPDVGAVQDEQTSVEKRLNNKVDKPDLSKPIADNTKESRSEISQANSTRENQAVPKKNNIRNYTSTGNKLPQRALRKDQSVDANVSEKDRVVEVDQKPVPEEVSKGKQINPVTDTQASTGKVSESGEKDISDSAANQVAAVQATLLDSAAASDAAEGKKAATKKLRSSLKWGLTASVGFSNVNDGGFFNGIFDGILGAEKAFVADVSPLMNTQSNAGPTAVVHQPSEIEKGFSFSLGAFVQKAISKRISVSTGLQYRYYSTHIRAGKRIDSFAMVQKAFGSQNISQYYRSAPAPTMLKYTNRFHFIELPISGHLQLNKGNRLPISWNAGVSLSYLVSTNALHFDSRTGLYYKDNDLLNKLQVGMSTGFAVTLLNASRMSVQLGPQLQYGLNNLMKQKVSDTKHLFYFGLNSRVFLKK